MSVVVLGKSINAVRNKLRKHFTEMEMLDPDVKDEESIKRVEEILSAKTVEDMMNVYNEYELEDYSFEEAN